MLQKKSRNSVSIAVIIMLVSNILSRLLGFGRMMVLAGSAGMGANVDAYSFSFFLPDIINHVLAGSALSITFIPMFQSIASEKGEEESWKFYSNIMTIGTVAFLLITILSLIFTDKILMFAGSNINDKSNPEQFELTVKLTRIIIPAQIFFFWGALLNGIQYAKKSFLLPALTPVVYNVGIIGGGILLYKYIGISSFSWGVLIGAFVGNVLIQFYGAIKCGMKYKFSFNFLDKDFLKWLTITVPFIFGLGLTFSNEFLFRLFGSASKDGAGAIASLDYSYKAMMFLVGIFGQSFAAGTYPFISQLAADGKISKMNKLIGDIVVKIAAVSLPVTAFSIVSSKNIISILFQRGAFGITDVERTAHVFVYYLPATFFMASGLIVIRSFYAVKDTILPLLINTVIIILVLPLYKIMGNVLGSSGIAATTSISLSLSFFSLMSAWYIKYKQNMFVIIYKKITIIAIISALTFFIDYYLSRVFSGLSIVANIKNNFIKNFVELSFLFCGGVLPALFIMELTRILSIREFLKSKFNVA